MTEKDTPTVFPTQLEAIKTVTDTIAREFRPERIILFGSHAYGEPNSDSDVDLLVVMDTPLREVDQAVAIGQGLNCPFGLDLIVRTPSNLERRVALGDWFLREAIERGTVMYERIDAGIGEQG